MYARVSTDIQLEGYSIDAQKEYLLSYAKAKEYTEFVYYIDGGYSGKDLNRPDIQRLIKDVKDHKIDCVFVFKLDRISRSQKDTLYLIEEVFNKHNVGFISIRENFDTTTPFGKAMIGILSVFAQLERETILERTRIGIQKRAEDGLWKGGGKIPFPYFYDRNLGILVPNPTEVKLLHKMISLYISGMSFIKIGSIVGMNESLVEKRIKSRTNLGIIPYKDKEFKGRHERVVSEELYQKIIETNKLRSKSRTARHYLLSGKIYCGNCGAKYRYQKWGKRLICYCYSQQKSKPKFIKDPNCKNKRWDSFEIEDLVYESLFSMALDKNLFKTNYELLQVNVLEEYGNRLIKVQKQIDNLINFLSDGIATCETKEKLKELIEEKETLELKIAESKYDEQKNIASLEMLQNLQSTWNMMTFEEQRMIIEHIIDKVIISNNEVEIKFKIS
ncbi:MAG: recombinase family protein [bacterium]|nr:recombinase family protein [bacterium]